MKILNTKVVQIVTTILLTINQTKADDDTTTELEESIWYSLDDVTTTEADPEINPNSDLSITKLTFNNSTIYALTSEICDAYPNLTHLHMKSVSLQKIECSAFDSCLLLEEIDVSDNEIRSLDDPMLFENNLKLTIQCH